MVNFSLDIMLSAPWILASCNFLALDSMASTFSLKYYAEEQEPIQEWLFETCNSAVSSKYGFVFSSGNWTTNITVVFQEKRSRGKAARCGDNIININDPNKASREEHKIDIVDEQSDLLGYEVFSGKLSPDKRKYSKNSELQTTDSSNLDAVNARLTSKV